MNAIPRRLKRHEALVILVSAALVLAFGGALPTAAWAEGSDAASDERAREQRLPAEFKDLRNDGLRERVPAVSERFFIKRHRHELAPLGKLSFADAFSRKYMGGAAYTFHAREHLAFTLRGSLELLRRHSGTARICDARGDCRSPTEDELETLPGNLGFVGGVFAEFAPIYGKINLVGQHVLRFDLYASIGAGAVGFDFVHGREDLSGISPALVLGVGQRYFLNRWFAVRLELLDVIYAQPTAYTVERGDNKSLQKQFLFTAGFSFFFPVARGP